MQNIQLAAEEIETLRDVLEQHIRELEVEVFRTDTHDFKEKLKERRTILNRLLAKLAPAPVGV